MNFIRNLTRATIKNAHAPIEHINKAKPNNLSDMSNKQSMALSIFMHLDFLLVLIVFNLAFVCGWLVRYKSLCVSYFSVHDTRRALYLVVVLEFKSHNLS